MFRRVANICATRSCVLAAATVPTATSSLTVAGLAPLQQHCQIRCAATDAAPRSNNNNNNNNRNRSANFNRQRNRRAALSPAFDVVHWNDEDVSRGHLLRVLHRDGFIVLDYHRQRETSAPTEPNTRRENRAEKVVTVTLPPVYVARFLGVLEGRMEKVEVQSRFTNATFTPNTQGGQKNSYTLHCTSMKPTTGQSQTVDGADVHEETVEWTVDFDPAESLMLHRFLTQALHFNSGFARNV